MPEGTRPGWRLLTRGHLDRREEAEAVGTARWIADHGANIGIRIPNVRERARALGLGDYYGLLEAQGLGAAQLFTAQGNAFDHVAVARRLGQAVRAWLRGGFPERHRYPAPSAIEDLYQRLRAPIEAGADGGPPLRCVPTAFPVDVYGMLNQHHLGGGAAAPGQPPLAGGTTAAPPAPSAAAPGRPDQ